MAETDGHQVATPSDDRPSPARPRERSVPGFVVAAGFAALVAVMAYFSFGMPGMDHGTATEDAEPMDGMEHDVGDPMSAGFDTLTPEAFAARALDEKAFVVNVHIPFDGEIAGTDDHIPYDRIAESDALPSDRAATILVYCRTGAMSARAAEALRAAGYTDVGHLRGGMDAWEAAGRQIIGSD